MNVAAEPQPSLLALRCKLCFVSDNLNNGMLHDPGTYVEWKEVYTPEGDSRTFSGFDRFFRAKLVVLCLPLKCYLRDEGRFPVGTTEISVQTRI